MTSRTLKNPSGKSTRITCLRPKLNPLVQEFLDDVDEDAFLYALETSPEGKLQDLAVMLTRVEYTHRTFSQICDKLGMTLKDLTEFWRDSQIQRGMRLKFNKMPRIMEQTAEDAMRQPIYCDRCDGKAIIIDGMDAEGELIERTCPKCHGEGEIEAPADRHARDMVYETAGLTNKRAPLVANQINVGVTMEDTISDISTLLDVTPQPTKDKESG